MPIGLVKNHQTVKVGLINDTALSHETLPCFKVFCKIGAGRKGSWVELVNRLWEFCHENSVSHSVQLNAKFKMSDRKRKSCHKLLLKQQFERRAKCFGDCCEPLQLP